VSASVPGTAGEPDLVLLTARDVTKRAVLEEELRQAQKMEAVGRLAGGIAHDFNNLMTAIGGYAELGLMRLGDAPGPHHELTQVRAAAMRASDLTRQLLAYSRKQMLDLHVLDLNEVVADTCSILERLLGGAVAVVLDLALDLGPTRADPGQISQVLLNLAINGRDAMPDGGTLTIATRNDGEGHIRLTVADTGHGMDADTLARVFEPFFTTKKVGDGTGLGLSTVHGIVHQLGGDVTAESAPGAGTTFEIVLPRADVQAVAA
jgi:signal transduction histidine kinase